MRQLKSFNLIFFIFVLLVSQSADSRVESASRGGGGFASGRSFGSRSPVMINMSRGSSGWNNRNFPSSNSSVQRMNFRPSYGQLHWNAAHSSRVQSTYWSPSTNHGVYSRPDLSVYSEPGVRAGVVVHHHPYSQGYVRQRLRKIGVTSEPNLITERSEMVHTDRQHSTIQLPHTGPGGSPLRATAISSRHFNDPIVSQQMGRLGSADWSGRISRYNNSEYLTNHYYWHQDDGLNYCHYIDNSGYSWWGWYSGNQCFWTRNYNGRWWWYDQDYNRWCFWNNNYWWWQDPNHLGDLYCYNDDGYVPCNSADDQVVAASTNISNEQTYSSPDGTRVVKVIGDGQDAFLYDTANPPGFDPVYLASGVTKVDFSNAKGRALGIILKLDDGSFDLFDNYGNSFSPTSVSAAEWTSR